MARDRSTNNGSQAQQGMMAMSGSGSSGQLAKQKLTSGLFITFEGGDGAGKTTQARRLADRIASLGITVSSAREPGGTELGEQVRTLVKQDSNLGPQAESLLFAAARAQLVREVLRTEPRNSLW